MITITPMQPGDWQAVRAIYAEGIATGLATLEAAPPSWETWDANHRPDARFVARDDAGTILGWAALTPVSHRCAYAGVAEVSVYVAAAARGRGIGKALLTRLIEAADASELWTLQAHIIEDNRASLKLHRGCGFRRVGLRWRFGERDGEWFNIVLMERRKPDPTPADEAQVQMIWPAGRIAPPITLPDGYALRTYQPGDESRFYEVMALAGWPGWDDEKLRPWLHRMLPEGWFMAVHEATGEIAATAMATHDHTWSVPFCGEVGWVAADPAHTGQGLGGAVVAAVTARFLECRYPVIHLFTETFRLPALKTYLKLGYVPYWPAPASRQATPEIPDHWRNICDTLNWPHTPDAWQQIAAATIQKQ